MANKTSICHLSSVHYALDTRIFYKMCSGLAEEYNVSLIAKHPRKETLNKVNIIPFYVFKNRNNRVVFSWLLMFFKAVKIKARIYHIHDPELMPCGLLLKIFGKKVIYDVHENIAEDIFDKPWIKHQKMAYWGFNLIENLAAKNFKIILAEKSYEKRYKKLNANFTTIQNFCDIDFFIPYQKKETNDSFNLFYIGILLENRSILDIIESVYQLKQKGYNPNFHIVGELYSDLKNKITNLSYFKEIKSNIHFYGRLPLDEGYKLSSKMDIGLCIIWPMKNSIESYPTKIFEYMAVGLPILTSNFELYKSVVETENCGLCVTPKSTDLITEKLIELYENKNMREKMRKNGILAVKNKYNWESQKALLMGVYRTILEKGK